jgi:hypothetical protein
MKKTPWKGRPPTLSILEVVNYKHLQQNKGVGSWLGPFELDYNQEHKEGPIVKGRKKRWKWEAPKHHQ